MHVSPQWVNRHLLLPLIDNKREELKMTSRLAALVKQVAELRDAGLWACHYAKEFTLWWILPLGHWEKLVYECPRFYDPNHERAASRSFCYGVASCLSPLQC
jgi:hypothetical protein